MYVSDFVFKFTAVHTQATTFSAKSLLQRLIDMSGYDGTVLVPEQLNETSVNTLFEKLADDMYVSFKGTLKCGNLESKILLSPAPVVRIKKRKN